MLKVVALSSNIDQLRAQQLLVQEQQAHYSSEGLSASLNLGSMAGNQYATDQIFQQNFKLYSDTSAAGWFKFSFCWPSYGGCSEAKQDAAYGNYAYSESF